MENPRDWFEQGASRTLREWRLAIAIDEVLRMQAADPNIVLQRNPVLIQMAEQARTQGATLLEPQVHFRVMKVDRVLHERLQLVGGIELKARLHIEHLKPAEFIVVALCTIGPGVEQEAKAQFNQNPVYGLALEGFGSAAVETLATEFCALVDTQASAAHMASSIPLSPGMEGWSVEEGQRTIFELLDASSIGVELTQSSMMLPVKTISLILGVGEDMLAQGSTCDYCSMRERCHYRDHYIHVENR